MSETSQIDSTPLTGATTPKTQAQAKSWLRRRRTIVVAAVSVAVIAGAAVWVAAGPRQGQSGSDVPTAKVTRGKLVVSVTEAGEVQAERRTIVSNDLKWPATILEVVPEGSAVQIDDLIIKFECKELTDAVLDQGLLVTSATNAAAQAKDNIELKQKEVDALVSKAENASTDAQNDLKKFREKEKQQKVDDAESAIKLADADLKLATQRLSFKKEINADPELNSPYSKNEIEADELSVQRLTLSLDKAKVAKLILETYDLPKQERLLGIAVTDAELDVARAKLTAKAQMIVANADLNERNQRLTAQQDRQDEMLADVERLEVKADRPGLIVYDTGGGFRGTPPPVVAVGERIPTRQQLMIIPDLSSLQVITRVYEGMVESVRLGMPAVIHLDARPEEIYRGQIVKIAALPDSRERYMNPTLKIFPVTVAFDTMPPEMKPGMTAQVEIIVAELPDVLSVPIAAVFTEQDQTYCWKLEDGKPKHTPVQVGRMNETRVQILGGLQEGETVLLAPPPGVPVPKHEAGLKPEGAPTGLDQIPATSQPAATSRPARNGFNRNGRGAGAPADGATTRPVRPRRPPSADETAAAEPGAAPAAGGRGGEQPAGGDRGRRGAAGGGGRGAGGGGGGRGPGGGGGRMP